MKNKILSLLISFLILSCKSNQAILISDNKSKVETTLNAWHKAAAEAKFDAYFLLMTQKGVFVGTDPTENWQHEAFKIFSKPYFDKGKAWSFTAIERNIYIAEDSKVAWFDELLDSQMKICRGSGVLILENGKWKVAHYVLSITIPNNNTTEIVKIKTKFDDELMKKLKK